MSGGWTPGVWEAEGGFVYANEGYENTEIAWLDYAKNTLQSAANAHLIAAAPELYEACVPLKNRLMRAIAIFGADDEALDGPITDEDGVVVTIGELKKVVAALAKARGEA